jgi:hypothetical protein
VWFAGPRDGLHWQGAVRFNLPWLQDKKLLGNPNALTEITLQILSHIEGNRPSTTH